MSSDCGRSVTSNSAIENHRTDKHLINQKYDRNLIDISNSFLKKSNNNNQLNQSKLSKKHM